MIPNNRLPSNIGIIHHNSKEKKIPLSNTKSIEFPMLSTSNNYKDKETYSYQLHSIIEDEFGNHPVTLLKDNTHMINRIKSSVQPKKRINSAMPNDMKHANKNIQINNDITSLMEENQNLKSELAKLKTELSNTKKEIVQLEQEIDKKDKIIDEVSSVASNNLNMSYGLNSINNITNTNQNNILSNINMKLIETKIVTGMKKQYKDLKKDYNKKIDEFEEIKRLLKTSKLNELAIENQTLIDELNKIKSFYKISVKENQNKIQLIKELESLQENFSKQQFMIISLQEKSEIDSNELNSLKAETMKDKAIIAERNKKISELKRNLQTQVDYSSKLNNFKENQEFIQIKKEWEKKMTELRKELSYIKQMNDKNGARKKDLEDEVKRLKESIKHSQQSKEHITNTQLIMDNLDESEDNKLLIYKNKLNELHNQNILLEKENKELKEQLNINQVSHANLNNTNNNSNLNNTNISHLNNTKLKIENTNVSSNLLPSSDQENDIPVKEIEKMKPLSEDNFNEMIYILMKNFEANKIDSMVIESAFPMFDSKTNSEIIQSLAKSIMYLLKNKNIEDLKMVCNVLVTFTKKKCKDLNSFKSEFLSIFENISLFSGEQKAHYNKHLRRKFKPIKDTLIRDFISCDKSIDKTEFSEESEIDMNKLMFCNNTNDHKYRYITFVDLRKIFDKFNISIDAELVEYLIYLMKSSFKDEKASLYDLNYLAFIEMLNMENVNEPESEEENDQSYEISPEAYEKILNDIFDKIKIYSLKKKIKPIDIFKEDIALVEEESSKARFHIIELKDFIDKLDNVIGLDVKELEIYCLYTKLKFDEVENDLEAISFDKLEKEFDDIAKVDKPNKSFSNANRLKLADMSKNKISLSQSGIFKQIEPKKESKHKEKEPQSLNQSMSIEVFSLTEFIDKLKDYIIANEISLVEIKEKIINDSKQINPNAKEVNIQFSLFNTYIKKENIIKGFLNMNDITDFLVTIDNEIYLLFENFFEFLDQVINKQYSSNNLKIQTENALNLNKSIHSNKSETFKVQTNEIANQLNEENQAKHNSYDSFDKELNDALSNFDD